MFYNLIESGKQFLCNFLLYNIFFGCKGTHFFANKPRNNY